MMQIPTALSLPSLLIDGSMHMPLESGRGGNHFLAPGLVSGSPTSSVTVSGRFSPRNPGARGSRPIGWEQQGKPMLAVDPSSLATSTNSTAVPSGQGRRRSSEPAAGMRVRKTNHVGGSRVQFDANSRAYTEAYRMKRKRKKNYVEGLARAIITLPTWLQIKRKPVSLTSCY